MIDTLKKYWFFHLPNIYISRNGDAMLLYDTKNGEHIETDSSVCMKLVGEMYMPSNAGVTELDAKVQSPEDLSLINELVEKKFCKVIEIKENEPRPMVLLPILNLQKDIDKMTNKDDYSIGNDLIAYLSELTLYINSDCKNDCNLCDKYCKQSLCCFKSNEGETLSPELIGKVLSQIKYSSVKRVNIIGGNIMLYPKWEELNVILAQYDYSYHYWIHYKNLKDKISKFNSFVNKDILVSFPLHKEVLKECISEYGNQVKFHFLIENEEQYRQSMEIITDCQIEKYNIAPIYNGENLNFFIDNVYIDEDDIFSSTISHREIFRNQKLNANYFGKLYILPDGSTKTNILSETLGNVKCDSVLKLLHKEILQNTAWRKIRDAKPCSNCRYQYLCPPLSNYETVIGKQNLCNIKK